MVSISSDPYLRGVAGLTRFGCIVDPSLPPTFTDVQPSGTGRAATVKELCTNAKYVL